jgi:hypothetical protein
MVNKIYQTYRQKKRVLMIILPFITSLACTHTKPCSKLKNGSSQKKAISKKSATCSRLNLMNCSKYYPQKGSSPQYTLYPLLPNVVKRIQFNTKHQSITLLMKGKVAIFKNMMLHSLITADAVYARDGLLILKHKNCFYHRNVGERHEKKLLCMKNLVSVKIFPNVTVFESKTSYILFSKIQIGTFLKVQTQKAKLLHATRRALYFTDKESRDLRILLIKKGARAFPTVIKSDDISKIEGGNKSDHVTCNSCIHYTVDNNGSITKTNFLSIGTSTYTCRNKKLQIQKEKTAFSFEGCDIYDYNSSFIHGFCEKESQVFYLAGSSSVRKFKSQKTIGYNLWEHDSCIVVMTVHPKERWRLAIFRLDMPAKIKWVTMLNTPYAKTGMWHRNFEYFKQVIIKKQQLILLTNKGQVLWLEYNNMNSKNVLQARAFRKIKKIRKQLTFQ